MIELLAPNGKPSNLTPEQYKLVRTPAFKEWFGDWENSPENASKVIDEVTKEPLVVYHATNNEFNVFDFNKADIGFHFGTFTQAKNRLETKLFFKGSKSNISMFFLNIKSIYQVSDIGDWEYPQRYLDMFMSDNIISESEFKKNGFQFLNYKEDNKKIRDFLIKKYNNTIGFEYNNKYEGKGKSYIVIHSNQIKLADGSNTTFDSNNPDIRYDGGGEARPFTDDGNKLVVFNQYRNYTPYKIAVDDVNNAKYITLWKTDTDTGEDKKMGYLRLNNSGDDFLSVSETSIDKGSKGLGLGLLMYKVALKYSSDKIKGIKSYLPDRTNKKQIPKIYKKLNSITKGDDYEYIYKDHNPNIKFNDGGSVLLAPNGKPSNLSPEQYKLVRQKAFKKWFGDWEILILTKINKSVIDEVSLKRLEDSVSNVIDENGEPLVVYRAIRGELDYERSGYQFFTPNKDYAKIYGENVISCFLDIKNLLDFEYYNKIIKDNKIDCGYSNEGLFQMGNYNLEKGLIKVYQSQLGCLQFDAPELADEIYDKLNTAEGLVGYEAGHYGKAISYLVKNPNQIKLADGSNTTFDSNNPDIRFDDGGETNKNMIIKFTPNIIDYLSDQVDIMMETYDYDDNGILDEGIEEEYPFTLAKNRNDLENLQLKIQNAKGSSYSKIEKDFLIARIDFTLDAMYDDSEMVSQIRALKYAQKKLQENNIDYADGGFVMDEEKGEKFIKKLSELGCNKPLTNFQMNFFGFLDSLKDDCVSLGGFWYDSNTTNYAYSQMGKMVLFDIEDFYNEKERSAFIEKNYPTSTPLEIQPFDDDNYEFIGIGEASMGGVFRDIRDGSILKLTASPFEVVGTTKILNAQKKDIHYEDNFAEIYSIQNIGKGVFKGTWYYKYYNEREFNGNWFAIRREDIKPFNEQEQKEANCVKEIIVNYYSMFDNKNYQPEIFGSYDIYEPNREYKYLLRKQNNYGEGGDINWNLDRYRQVEKEMYDLRTQGKGDTLEYFKLIKERSILEQAKMNPSSDSKNSFAKGGNIIAYKKDFQKFNKIGVTDKYIIEAITEIGLQDTKFDKESIEKTIENEFKKLINSYQEYIISEDSNEISRQILFDKNARFLAGDEDENLKDFDNLINSKERRKEEYIEKYADTQIETINEWISYLTQSEYPVAIKFLLLKSVLNFNYNYKIDDLIKRTDTTIRNFTLFDAGSLSELIASNSDYLLKDYTKIQLENAEKILKSKEFVKTSGDGTWLKFNGGSNSTEEEISKNSIELSQLVQNTYWCTKTNSKSQLDGGDFYVYVTKNNGEIFPRIAIRMEEDLVGEVRGNKSSAQDIEEEMLPIAEEFLQKSISNNSGKKWLDSINYNKEALNFSTKLTEDGIFENSVEEFIKLKSKEKQNLLDYADRNGHIVRIENLLFKLIKSPNKFYAKNEVISDIKKFTDKTKIIIGDADFEISKITDLGNLTTIEGNVNFSYSQVTNLGNLTTIGGTADFTGSQVTNLGNLTTIEGYAYFTQSIVTDLKNLTTIGGSAEFRKSKITNLGNLTTIVGTAHFSYSQVTNLGNLQTIGGTANFGKSKITNLGNLTTIINIANFEDSKVTNLGNLTTIGGYANFNSSEITDLGNLTTIGGNVYFGENKITNLKNLKKINGDVTFTYSQVTNLGNLTTIGGTADFTDSQVTNLGNLTTIVGTAYFKDSKLTNLGNLTTIVGTANFKNSKITDLKNLTTIGGTAYFENSQVTDLGNLTTIGGNAEFFNSKLKDLGNLTTINGDAYFENSQITDLKNLITINGSAVFTKSEVTNLGNLTTIGVSADFQLSKVINLGNLTTIEGNAYFGNSKITDLKNLKTIKGYAFFGNSKLINLGNLQTIEGDANFIKSQVTDLGNLTTIGGDAEFNKSKITDLKNLTTIGGYANFENSQVTNLGNLKTIGGNPYFDDSQITNLGNLTTIKGNVEFRKSKITDLGNLTTIEGDVNFGDSQVTNLGNLTTIEGFANFGVSQITNLGNLTTIGGTAYFENSQVTNLGNLTTIEGYAYFGDSQVINLGNLQTIGGTANFGDRIDLKKEWEKIKNTNKNKTKNMNIQTTENFAKGGKILIKEINENGNIKIVHQDFQKFLRIGIADKYFIEASNDVGLQGVNFDEKSLMKKISVEYNNLLEEYEDYIISEDSEFITNIMNNNIKIEKRRGASLEVITNLESEVRNESSRKREIDTLANTQKESLEQWIIYLKQSDYDIPFKYLLLKAILNFNYTLNTNKLSERSAITIRNFTPFDAGSLAELYYNKSNYLLKDYVLFMNENSKKVFKTQEVISTTNDGKWIKFNGGSLTSKKEKDENGLQLMRLVQNTYWCTKSAGRTQLNGGDFYVYVTEKDGEILPRIAVRMDEDKVGEIRGNYSSAQDIEPDMLPISETFLLENIPNDSGKKWLDSIQYNSKCVDMYNRFVEEGMYKDFIYDYIKLIADKSSFKVDYGENGNVTNLQNKFKEIIQNSNEFYKRGDIQTNVEFLTEQTIYFMGNLNNYTIEKLNNKRIKINELKNWKLKVISEDLECSNIITDLGNIEYIGKSLYLSPNFENLNKLKYIGGKLEFNGSNIETLNNLEYIGSGLILDGKIKDLGKLKKIGFLQIKSVDDGFSLSNIEEIIQDLEILNYTDDIDFGNLKTIGGSLIASNSKILDLKNLEAVGNNFIINGSKIKNLGNLKTIGGNADFSNNFCSSTQNIESILGNIKFLNSRIMEFPKLNKIGGTIDFKGSYFKSFGNIKFIGGNLNFAESKVDDLGNLEYIGGYASFKSSSSNIKSLKKLKNIVKFANFTDSAVEDLGDLETIGGNAYFVNSKIKSLGKLNFVGGLVMMKKNNYDGLEGFVDVISEQLKN